MTVLNKPMREAFAWALARGLSPGAAAREAGYFAPRKGAALARADDIVARAEEIRAHLRWGGSRDLDAPIDELRQIASDARRLANAAGMVAARSAVVEAARLKQLMATPRAARGAAAPAKVRDEVLTDEEWMVRFGPEAPRHG